MSDLSSLAPIIGGVAALVSAVAVMVWMQLNKPQLHSQTASRPEEEAQRPFEGVVQPAISPEEELLRHIFGETREEDVLSGPTLPTRSNPQRGNVVIRLRAKQSADT